MNEEEYFVPFMLCHTKVCQTGMAVSQPCWEVAISVLWGPEGVSDWLKK